MRTHTKRRRLSRPGFQHMWGFDNGRLVSVVPDAAQQNRWQLTVMDGSGSGRRSAPAARDVIGSLLPIDVRHLLRDVEARR